MPGRYTWTIQIKALEVPTDPEMGISVEGLQFALEEWSVVARVVVANCSNPPGSLMPDDRKAALVELIEHHQDVVLIEDKVRLRISSGKRAGPNPG